MPAPRHDRVLLAIALGVWLAAAVAQHLVSAPLGGDEAEYVLGAQRLWAGKPPLYLYTSVGTELLALPGVAFGWSGAALRGLATLAGLLLPIGAYALARAAFVDRRVAGWTVIVVAGSHKMLQQSSEILTDLPAAGSILIALAILIRELARPAGPTARIVWAAPALGAAFYLRYGSLPVLAVIAVLAAILYRRSIARRPAPVVALVAAVAVLAIPFFYFSLQHTGTLLGTLQQSVAAPPRRYLGDGLVTYVTTDPFTYYGYALAPLALVGLVIGWTGGAHARFLALVAVAQVVAVGAISIAQPRYVFVAVSLLAMLGIAALVPRVDRLRGRARQITSIVAGTVAATCLVLALISAPRAAQRNAEARALFVELAGEITHDAAGRPCVVAAGHEPQLTYYTGCEPYHVPSDAPPPSGYRGYVVTLPRYPLDAAAVARQLGQVTAPLAGTQGQVVVIESTR